MASITIDSAVNDNGILRVTFTKSGQGGGHGWSYPVVRLSEQEVDMTYENLFSFFLTWARRNNQTPAQMVGKTITVNMAAATNIVSVT